MVHNYTIRIGHSHPPSVAWFLLGTNVSWNPTAPLGTRKSCCFPLLHSACTELCKSTWSKLHTSTKKHCCAVSKMMKCAIPEGPNYFPFIPNLLIRSIFGAQALRKRWVEGVEGLFFLLFMFSFSWQVSFSIPSSVFNGCFTNSLLSLAVSDLGRRAIHSNLNDLQSLKVRWEGGGRTSM